MRDGASMQNSSLHDMPRAKSQCGARPRKSGTDKAGTSAARITIRLLTEERCAKLRNLRRAESDLPNDAEMLRRLIDRAMETAMQQSSRLLWERRKLHNVLRSERPHCGARTRAGTPCKAQALKNGRCFIHGGLSTGPRTEEGKASMAKAASERMRRQWAKLKAEGRSSFITPEGRKRIGNAQKRRWDSFKTTEAHEF